MRLALPISVAVVLFMIAAPESEGISLWLAVAIAALSLGGVAVNQRSR